MAKRRKKQNDALYILVLTCLSALLFFAVVMGVTGIVGKIAGDPVPTFAPKPIEEAKEIQVVSADLVLVTDGAGGLYAAFLAELDCVNLYWRMNVIPLDTRLEISPTLYRECVKENVSTPQLTTIAELYKCLPGESAARLTLSAIRELLPFEPDYYVEMKRDTYQRIFRERPETYAYDAFLSPDLKEKIRGAGGLMAFIKNIHEDMTGKPVEADLFALETYENLSNLRVNCRLIPGSRHSNGYVVMAVKDDFFRK